MEDNVSKLIEIINRLTDDSADLTFIGVLITGVLSIASVWIAHHLSKTNQKREWRINQKKEALLEGLEVIDLVYANITFTNMPPPLGVAWQIQRARSAINRMLIFCENPEATLKAFYRSIGAHNPQVEDAPQFSMASVNDFRREVARELGITEERFLSKDMAWLANLPGTEQDELYKQYQLGIKIP